ncbi:peptidoglycan D,D-transpeptidase FtsI family protein [Paenibacillus pini]|uniref:peptidoglycan D,D-transpeptidase FtsI family protein n=1 Tax=Paenibacillus pini TaxID=669461 RepID=UPI00278C3173|nr:penicillin-binding protein 2 [Paenibacillus pini]
MFYTLLLLTGIMILIILRLAYIQLILRSSKLPESQFTLQEMSVLQRERGVVLDSGRGKFYDRFGIPLTDETIPAAVLFPVSQQVREEGHEHLEEIAHELQTEVPVLQQTWSNLNVPILWTKPGNNVPLGLKDNQVKQMSKLKVSGIEILPYESRYRSTFSGMQWLGYLTQQADLQHLTHTGYAFQKGASGLERTLEPLLKGKGPTTAYYTVDGRNQPVPGTGIRVKSPGNSYYPLHFNTTVDASLQHKLEQLTMNEGMNEGAIVVLDADTADVRAMVSRPFYNPLDIKPNQKEWNNRALQAAVPGSIFKTVVAAAALEARVTSKHEHFYCSGHYGKYGLSCWKEGGHGNITLEEAFADSCNVVFATLAERLSKPQLEQAAYKLGLGRRVGWEATHILGLPLLRPFDHEQSGVIFTDNAPIHDGGILAQTGIGQRDVQVTPLQAANLIVTLLHGGKVQSPRILQNISYSNGQLMKELPSHSSLSSEGSIRPQTARLLKHWMEKVVTEGTGQSLSGSLWTLAGKSGTAQVIVNGRARNNQWFIGYGPADQPKYAVAVLIQNASPDSRNRATIMFGKVMDTLAAHTS